VGRGVVQLGGALVEPAEPAAVVGRGVVQLGGALVEAGGAELVGEGHVGILPPPGGAPAPEYFDVEVLSLWYRIAKIPLVSSFQFAVGDRFPLVAGLRDSKGEPVIPTVGSTCSFRMVERSTKKVVAGAATLDGDRATWTPGANDLAVAGIYDAQFVVVWPNGERRHFPTKVGPSALAGFVVEVCASP
jgi:hypothetical protein